MGLFQRKTDPIRDREAALKSTIHALEKEIQDLSHRIEEDQHQPKLRSTAKPGGGVTPDHPAFEDINHARVHSTSENTPQHFNDLGVRKYDLAAAIRRWMSHLHGSPTPNPKLVNFLAAGSIHGLRPLRYEKRVARNRFLALFAGLAFLVWGLVYLYFRNR